MSRTHLIIAYSNWMISRVLLFYVFMTSIYMQTHKCHSCQETRVINVKLTDSKIILLNFCFVDVISKT
jgi:hypothetical protein